MSDSEQNIEALLSEKRVFEPSEAFVERALISDRSIYDQASSRSRGLLGGAGGADLVVPSMGPRDGVERSVGQMVHGRDPERLVQLPGPPRRGGRWRQGRVSLGGRAGGHPDDHVPGAVRGDLSVRQRLEGPGCAARAIGSRSTSGMVPELPVAMLACARIGAPHSVVFGGFSAEALKDRINDAEATVLITADGGYRRGQIVPLKESADTAVDGVPDDQARRDRSSNGRGAHVHAGARPLVPRVDRRPTRGVSARGDGRRGLPVPALHERHHRQAEGHRAHDGRLHDAGRRHAPLDLRHPRGRRVLVRGGHRMGDRSLLHRLRPAREPHDGHHLRGRARLARQGPAVVDRGEVQGDDPLHGADGHPRVHALGDGVPRAARPLVAATARFGGRADQPRGVGLVLEVHRRRALSGRRHVVADRDGRDPDHTAPGRHPAEARVGDEPVPGHRGRRLR